MSLKPATLAALALLAAAPAAAQDAPAAPEGPAPCAATSAHKGPGLGALLSAANRAGARDLLSGRSGQFLGGSKKSAIAGAVLGSALSAADAEGAAGNPGYGAPPPMPGTSGGKTAQIAAVATTAVISLARSHAPASACAH